MNDATKYQGKYNAARITIKELRGKEVERSNTNDGMY